MATRKEILEIGGREVAVSNPDKVYFPRAGHTKLDLVRYFLAVADGALVGVRGRPMALKRFVDGAEKEPFFQKRAPDNRPDWMRVATLTFPSGRTADEIVVDEAAGLAWVANLGCLDLNPHPVRAEDLDHPDELRVDLDPVPGVPVVAGARGGAGLPRGARGRGPRGLAEDVRVAWDPRQRADRAALDVPAGPPRGPGAGAGRGAARAVDRDTPKWWKEERHGVFLDYNQNAKDRTVASAYSVRPTPDARVSFPLRWDEVPDAVMEDFTLATVPALYAERGDAGAGIDDAVGSLEALLELSARHEAEGEGDAPWPPNYAKQEGEPPRVQPSRKRRADAEYAGRGKDGGPPPEVAEARAAAVAAGDPNAGPADGVGGLATVADRVAAAPASRSSSSAARRRRPMSTRASTAGRPATPRPRRTWSPPTSSRPRCAAAPMRGTGCGSTSSTCRPSCGHPRSRSTRMPQPDDWASLSDDERAAWMAGRTRSARPAPSTDEPTG